MPELNENLPVFECLIRREFLYNGKRAHGEYEKCAVFGVASVPGRALGFHCLLPNGAVYSRLPIHALVHKSPPEGTFVVSDLQLWDAPSEHVSCIEYDFLKESRCHVYLPGGEVNGTYMFTLDWHGSSYADSAGALGWKHAHFIRMDNGYFCAQPNNRVLFELPCWTKVQGKPDYALCERVYKCEVGGTTTDEYFYEVEKPHVPGPGEIVRGGIIVCATCLNGPCTCPKYESILGIPVQVKKFTDVEPKIKFEGEVKDDEEIFF